MRIKFLSIAILLTLVASIFFIIQNKPSSKPSTPLNQTPSQPEPTTIKEVNYMATFEIFTNGLKRDFSSSRYHNLSTDIFIEPQNPQTVHVKKPGLTWNDFFKTLPMKLSNDCLVTGTNQTFCNGDGGILQFFVNGQKVEQFLSKEIKNGDQAKITFGTAPN